MSTAVSGNNGQSTGTGNTPVTLPAMLSPTLPGWADELVPPQRMLSPTLPDMFEKALDRSSSSPEKQPTKAEKLSSVGLPKDTPALALPKPQKAIVSGLAEKLDDMVAKKPIQDKLVQHKMSQAATDSTTVRRRRQSLVVTLKVGEALKKVDRSAPAPPAKPSHLPNKPPVKKPANSLTTGSPAPAVQSTTLNGSAASTASSNGTGTAIKRRSLAPEPAAKKKKFSRSYSSDENEDDVPLAVRKKKITNGTKLSPVRAGTAATKRDDTPSVVTPKDKSINNSNNTSSLNPAEESIRNEKREKFYRLLRSKMHNWIDIAREKKHEGDAVTEKKDHGLSQVISLDSLFAFIVGFDYEDRGELMMKREPGTSSWSTLVPYIARMIKMFEREENGIFIGLVHQIRALIHLRIASRQHSELQRAIRAASGEDSNQDIAALANKYMASNDAALQDFKRGFHELNLDVIQKNYPKTWAKRAETSLPVSSHEGGYRPLEDPYWLPLHTFSSLQEATAFGYALTKEWADSKGISCEWALIKGLR